MGRIIYVMVLVRFLGLFFGVIGVIGGVFIFILLVRVWLDWRSLFN